jgi:transposase-like protein
MITAPERPSPGQPSARRAISAFDAESVPERNWKLRGGNVSLLGAAQAGRKGSQRLDLRDPHERALLCAIQEAYVHRTGSPAVDALADVLGLKRITREAVGQASNELDRPLLGFLHRPISGVHPYLLLETVEVPVRTGGAVHPATVVFAIGVRGSGHREVLGAEVTEELNAEVWLQFLRGLNRRGLDGVRLVTADEHAGLQLALRAALPTAAWQRCLTHFLQDAVDAVPASARVFAAATLRRIFAQPDRETARRAVDRVTRRIARRNPRLADLLRQADPACLTYFSFPAEHRRQIWSTNAERVVIDLTRRCELVGTFPSRRALLRLVAEVLEQQDAAWQAAGPYCRGTSEPAFSLRETMIQPFREISFKSSGGALFAAAV